MPEIVEPEAAPAEVVEPVEAPEAVEPEPGENDLGDAGKKALDAMKADRNAAKASNKALQAELAQLRAEIANKDKPAEEQALDSARREAAAEATAKSDARLVRAELKAAAATKVKNPALALRLIDTSEIEVGEDGEVDQDALNQAIDDLLTEYPELAADAGSKFGGGADQGAKGKVSKPSQLSKQELSKLTPEQVVKARADGRLDALMGK